MTKAATISSQLPPPGGPYSHVVEAGGFAYTAGLGPEDPATGAIPDGIRAQTDQVLRNLESALAAVGLTMADVIKTTVHLADLRVITGFNEAYRTRFPEPYPGPHRRHRAAVPGQHAVAAGRNSTPLRPAPRERQLMTASPSRRGIPADAGCWPTTPDRRARPTATATSGSGIHGYTGRTGRRQPGPIIPARAAGGRGGRLVGCTRGIPLAGRRGKRRQQDHLQARERLTRGRPAGRSAHLARAGVDRDAHRVHQS